MTVQVEGKTTGTVTDLDGQFTLTNVPSNGTLLFTYVGMQAQTIPLNGRTTLSVTMSEDTELLEEVGCGWLRSARKESVVGAIAQTNSKVLEAYRWCEQFGTSPDR